MAPTETKHETSDVLGTTTTNSSNPSSVTLIAKWGKERIELTSLHPQTNIREVKQMLMEQTGVLPERQKIIGLSCNTVNTNTGGKQLRVSDDVVLADLKVKGKKREKAGQDIIDDGAVVHSFIMMGTAEKNQLKERNDLPEVIDDFDLDFNAGSDEWVAHVANETNLKKFTESTDITIIHEPRPNKPLMVLDLDHTLLDFSSKKIIAESSSPTNNVTTSSSSSNPNTSNSANIIAKMKRPHMDEFLTKMYPHYDLVVWSQTSWRWLETKLTELGMLTHPGYKWCFVLDKTSMFQIISQKRNGARVSHYVKPLQIIWSKFPGRWGEHNTVHLDDLSRNFALNLKNGLKVTAYYRKKRSNRSSSVSSGANDVELHGLSIFLEKLALQVKDFTKVDFRYWADMLSGKRKLVKDEDIQDENDGGGGKLGPS